MKPLKIAVIGGGSTYTPELIDGFVRYHSDLPVGRIVLQDISTQRLDIVGGLARRMVQGTGIELCTTTDRAEALEEADFVIAQLRVGGMAARALDERLPLEYGVIGQETTGPGGFAKALRTVPVMLEIAHDIARLAPQAWLINFTNPAGLITEAILRHTGAKAIGLCNVPINMVRSIAQTLNVDASRIELDYVGLNHLSWVRRVLLDGEDVTERLLHSDTVWGGAFSEDFLQQLGMIPNYYIRYFVHTDHVLAQMKNGGSTRGEYLQEVEADLLKLYSDPTLTRKPDLLGERGGAYYSTAAVELIRSIAQDRRDVHIVNVRNNYALPDLAPDSVVEVPAVIGKSGPHPVTSGRLPASIRGLVASVKAFEELTIDAAVTGNEDTARLALLSHPLVPSWDVAVSLWDAIKAAHHQYLPQFS